MRNDPTCVKFASVCKASFAFSHPLFWGLPEQFEEMAKIFEELKPQEAYIKLAHYWRWQRGFQRLKFRTVTLKPHHSFPFIQTLRNYYAKTLLTPIAHLSDTISASLTPLPAARNRINF